MDVAQHRLVDARVPLVDSAVGAAIGEEVLGRGDHLAAREDLAEAMDRVRHHAIGGERVGAPRDQAHRLLEVVVAIAEVALREARAHLLRLGADRAVREVVGRAEDLGQRAVQELGGG